MDTLSNDYHFDLFILAINNMISFVLFSSNPDAIALKTAAVRPAQPALPVAHHLAFRQAVMCQAAEAPKYVLNSIPMQGNWFQNQKGARLQPCWTKSLYASSKKH